MSSPPDPPIAPTKSYLHQKLLTQLAQLEEPSQDQWPHSQVFSKISGFVDDGIDKTTSKIICEKLDMPEHEDKAKIQEVLKMSPPKDTLSYLQQIINKDAEQDKKIINFKIRRQNIHIHKAQNQRNNNFGNERVSQKENTTRSLADLLNKYDIPNFQNKSMMALQEDQKLQQAQELVKKLNSERKKSKKAISLHKDPKTSPYSNKSKDKVRYSRKSQRLSEEMENSTENNIKNDQKYSTLDLNKTSKARTTRPANIKVKQKTYLYQKLRENFEKNELGHKILNNSHTNSNLPELKRKKEQLQEIRSFYSPIRKEVLDSHAKKHDQLIKEKMDQK